MYCDTGRSIDAVEDAELALNMSRAFGNGAYVLTLSGVLPLRRLRALSYCGHWPNTGG